MERLLERFFHDDPERRWELQLVADEVGMGKTFVALATAYAVLRATRGPDEAPPDLARCQRRVLVIAPQNAALVSKWQREVGEFIKRCWTGGATEGDARHPWFTAGAPIARLDDLAAALCREEGPGVLVTHMGVLGSAKLVDYELKRRYVLGHLFRVWSNRLPLDARERLLRGTPEGWPRDPRNLLEIAEGDRTKLPLGDDIFREALDQLAARDESDPGRALFDGLLSRCKEAAEPYTHDRNVLFKRIEGDLTELYRHVCFAAASKALPLVIVDEAHNWKNGPRAGSNGYERFRQFVAPRMRRALLLTATPFQLHPDEMLELLKAGDALAPCPTRTASVARTRRLADHREKVLAPVLRTAADRSRAFARTWAAFPTRLTGDLDAAWSGEALLALRVTLRDLAHAEGAVDGGRVERLIDAAVVSFDPELRAILREALRLYAHNEDLSQELGAFVIRHRRRTEHRLVRVGSEYEQPSAVVRQRPDRSVLHAAPGLDVRGEAELPHYLLMRLVSLTKSERGRTSLGTALTGCYSTLHASAEGRTVAQNLKDHDPRATYLRLLRTMTTEARDVDHPKVRAVVDATVRAWRAGEKTLIFCFRTHTSKRLQALLGDRIEKELRTRRGALSGGADALTRLRSRFTRREGDLVSLGLDRVLWSVRWAAWSNEHSLPEVAQDDLRLTDDELDALARLALRHGVDLRDETPDRVFLHRATEHLLARRMRTRGRVGSHLFRDLLEAMSRPAWVERAYGLDGEAESLTEATDGAPLDERGVHFVYKPRSEPDDAEVAALGQRLRERRERARRQGQVSLFDVYAEAPSFWLGASPESNVAGDAGSSTARALASFHGNLLHLTRARGRGFEWRERRMVFQALRRALMRESLLLRLLPERSDLHEQGWGEVLVQRFFEALPGQRESNAERLAVFVEDLRAASGSVSDGTSERHALYDATRMRETSFVALVDGSTSPERRNRVFAGFNSPLLPEVLICTTVGQEGIDLHRHCRHVVHYDLAWNPAVLEQRTGRVDRIGSKTFRERAAAPDDPEPAVLDVGVPFLAATYDERMYEELRVRAQTFEVLTGGDVAADNPEGADDIENAQGEEQGLTLPALPLRMVDDLRVRLQVWSE